MSVIDKYNRRASESLLCVGLDSSVGKMPERFQHDAQPQFAFNRWIIDQTHAYVSAYKPNIAFYEARGDLGLRELKLTMEYLQAEHPDILTICDAKRADMDSTSVGYVAEIFDWLGCDAVTLNPYLGRDALQPFLSRVDKGCIILCRTSNPDAGELQDLLIEGKLLWQVVAEKVRDEWDTNGNCMLVVGATHPEQLAQVRGIVGEMTLLVPGIGAQGGSVEAVVKAGVNAEGKGLIINASRSVIFAENPGDEARKLHEEINRWR
ncbi:MAG: orotidine-5'-phosphate decarboxylase [Chloroflexota bacterium]